MSTFYKCSHFPWKEAVIFSYQNGCFGQSWITPSARIGSLRITYSPKIHITQLGGIVVATQVVATQMQHSQKNPVLSAESKRKVREQKDWKFLMKLRQRGARSVNRYHHCTSNPTSALDIIDPNNLFQNSFTFNNPISTFGTLIRLPTISSPTHIVLFFSYPIFTCLPSFLLVLLLSSTSSRWVYSYFISSSPPLSFTSSLPSFVASNPSLPTNSISPIHRRGSP